ncbi:AAA family ATPase [candidate division KSB1 bacterium]|nr:AAA family ATPase [candidate division KSB1 bacterium]
MHLEMVNILPSLYPTKDYYPFNLKILEQTPSIKFETPVTFFSGENGTGKTTLLKALAQKCGIHIWGGLERARFNKNPYEETFHQVISVQWRNGMVPGSFFSSQMFRNFAQLLDEWASIDANLLDYFGGSSLMSQSHGQSLLSFFTNRYKIKGLYLLDEPETALSPKSQMDLLKILAKSERTGKAQFIIATHSPILLACPGAVIFNFDGKCIQQISYEKTEYFMFYKKFFENREHILANLD